MRKEIQKGAMSSEERSLRSRASKLLSAAGLVHGSLSIRHQQCGKPNCRCTRGEKHETFVLVLHKEGKREQIPIPRDLVEVVRDWVDQEKALQELLSRISELQTEMIRELKRKRTGR